MDWDWVENVFPNDVTGFGACILACFKGYLSDSDSNPTPVANGGFEEPPEQEGEQTTEMEQPEEGDGDGDDPLEADEGFDIPLSEGQKQLAICIGGCYITHFSRT